MTTSAFAELGLSDRLLRALEDTQYDTPTPIQKQSIPLLLDGADLLGIAQTGTGKTAAFTLPLLQNLEEDGKKAQPRCPRALILAPTRELALQISDSIKTYAKHMKIRQAVVMGGVSQRPQSEALRRGVDILIATPGRLIDLMNQRNADLSQCEFLILDEADRMFDMGFIRDVRKIVAQLPDERQTLLFSATMPAEVAKLAGQILYEPERVEIAAKSVAVDRIEQQVHHLSAPAKRDFLAKLLEDAAMSKVIVFTRTKHRADQVVKHLARTGVVAEAIHGRKSQNARQRALESFRKGDARVLVATDIVARGIDVDDVTHVINFELPNEPESYVHRIGRTARAGANGVAISFCDPSERPYLRLIEKLINRSLSVVGDVPPEPTGAEAKKQPRGGRGRGRGQGQRQGQNKGPGQGKAQANGKGQQPNAGKRRRRPRRADNKRAA